MGKGSSNVVRENWERKVLPSYGIKANTKAAGLVVQMTTFAQHFKQYQVSDWLRMSVVLKYEN